MNASLRDRFAALHRKGEPLLLYSIWDAGSAAAVARAGAPAIATGSHSLAGALGFADGEQIPHCNATGLPLSQQAACS